MSYQDKKIWGMQSTNKVLCVKQKQKLQNVESTSNLPSNVH
jgi:hypothetical protein